MKDPSGHVLPHVLVTGLKIGFADGIVQLVQVPAVPAQVAQVLEHGYTFAKILAIIPVVYYTITCCFMMKRQRFEVTHLNSFAS